MSDFILKTSLCLDGFSGSLLPDDRETIISRLKEARSKLPKPWKSQEIFTILDGAFKLGLKRNDEWLGKNSDETLWASLIYKRGATLRDKSSQKIISMGLPLEDSTTDILYTFDLERYFKAKEKMRPLWIVCNDVVDLIPELNHFENVSFVDLNENSKTFESVEDFLSFTEPAYGHCPEWIIIGGGVVTDIIGFAAFLKGVPISLLPTTLLGMVDAAIGGKTGVNHSVYGKNQIGAFYAPKEVIVSTVWFKNSHNKDPLLLARRRRAQRAGLSEAWKHRLLEGDLNDLTSTRFTDEMQSFLDLPASSDSLRFVQKSTQIKIEVVQADPYETLPGKGRIHLNLGHSCAHILESLAEKTVKKMDHGEAVAVGILFTLSVSHSKSWIPTPLYKHLYSVTLRLLDPELEAAALLKSFSKNKDYVINLLNADKKNAENGVICEVLLRVYKDKLETVVTHLTPADWWIAAERFLAEGPLNHFQE